MRSTATVNSSLGRGSIRDPSRARNERSTMVLPLGDLHRTRITPVVTYALIAINVVVYLVQVDRGEQFTMALACTPWEITHNEDIDEPIVKAPAVVRVQDPRPDGRVIEVERPGRQSSRTPHPDSRLADPVHVDVPARKLDALARQHALPLDRRRQRRGGAGLGSAT